MKKILFAYIILLCFVLVGCGTATPKDVVNDFMKAVQNNDWELAFTYIDNEAGNFDLDEFNNEENADTIKQLLSSISNSFEYEQATEETIDGNHATVKINITSIDFSVAFTSTMAEVLPIAFGIAFSADEEAAQQQIEALTEATLLKHLNAENATMATRDVTLNLKKNDDGDYLIIADDNLAELILANYSKVGSFLGSEE